MAKAKKVVVASYAVKAGEDIIRVLQQNDEKASAIARKHKAKSLGSGYCFLGRERDLDWEINRDDARPFRDALRKAGFAAHIV